MSPRTAEAIDDDICELLRQHSGDRHIDGHEEICAYVLDLLATERAACANTAAAHECLEDDCLCKLEIERDIRGRSTPND